MTVGDPPEAEPGRSGGRPAPTPPRAPVTSRLADRTCWLLLVALAPSVPACGSPATSRAAHAGSATPGVRVTVLGPDGAARDAYEGAGGFTVDDADGVTRPKHFRVHVDAADARGRRSLTLWRAQGAQATPPVPGTYPIAVPERAPAHSPGMAGTYTAAVDGWFEGYVGTAGTVTVTESSAGRVAGTFRFTATRYYRRPLRGTGTEAGVVFGQPDAPPPGQPSVQVTGAFDVLPERRGAERVEFLGGP